MNERYRICAHHGIPYPVGAGCPMCLDAAEEAIKETLDAIKQLNQTLRIPPPPSARVVGGEVNSWSLTRIILIALLFGLLFSSALYLTKPVC